MSISHDKGVGLETPLMKIKIGT